MFPFCIDAPASAILEMIMLIVPVIVWFTSLLTCSRC
ncbi:hypothetical protein Pan241w_28030 [Gimesia alba]|uniref:Uncharacterized protein n=1 Tax=Gimesia alba TaxID=2527973 RepID=A0A517RFU2_9PLAN|nr:hypothetical protein Pan241w_28030 [Gimesia alba]